MNYDKTSKESILEYAKKLETFSLSDFTNFKESNFKGKGRFGQLIEEGYFGYKPNSNSEPDFPEAGLELKSTPLKKLKNGQWVCKERLVLNIINFLDVSKEDFYSSSFWKKNENILLLFYLWEKEALPINYVFDLVDIMSFSSKDLKIIENDWHKIKAKIDSGKAHEISEGDTLYLGACTKGSTAAKSLREQPFSEIKAKQRAYSLKRGYLNSLYTILKLKSQSEFAKDIVFESAVNEEELDNSSFEEIILSRFSKYISMTDIQILKSLEITLNKNSKNYFSSISKRIMGVGEKSFIEEFEKANIVIKTIRVESNNSIKENISFPAFKFNEIVTEEWENSTIKELVENKFLFIFFKKHENSYSLEKVTFHNLNNNDLDEFERVFSKTKEIISSGNIIKNISTKVFNNFPKTSESYLTHIRPHARNKKDTYPLPIADKKYGYTEFTKQCFWLNSSYVENIYLNH